MANPSKTSIISKAFVLLGKAPINSLNTAIDNGVAGVAAAIQIYDSLYPKFLSQHPWRFATKTLQLNLINAPTGIVEYQSKFQLPSDLLQPQRVRPQSSFRIFGDELFSNQSELQLDYIFQPPEADMPFYFEMALTYELAANIAMTITQQPQIAQLWNTKAEQEIARARYLDSMQQTADSSASLPIFRSHFTGSSHGIL